jgi:hypothetical protein
MVGGGPDDIADVNVALSVDPVTGDFFFGGGANAPFTTAGYTDIDQAGGFLVRAQSSGKVVWARSIRWTSADTHVLSVDAYVPSSVPRSQHFVVACGSTADQLTARYTNSGGSSTATTTGFLQRYALNGTLEWETGFPTTVGWGSCLSVRTLSGGNIVVLLQLVGSGGSSGTYQGVTSPVMAAQSIALMMLNSAGKLMWFYPYGSDSTYAGALAVHDTGSLSTSSMYITANFGVFHPVLRMWRVDASNGAPVWTKEGGAWEGMASGIAVNANNTRVCVVGRFGSSSIEYPPGNIINRVAAGNEAILLAMQALDGTPISGTTVVPQTANGHNDFTTVAIDPTNGDVYLGGVTDANDFAGAWTRGFWDAVVIRLDAALNVQWVQRAGGTKREVACSVVFSPHHQGVLVVGDCWASDTVYPATGSVAPINSGGDRGVLVLGFNTADGKMLTGTDFPGPNMETEWNATTAGIVGSDARSSDAQPTVTVPYALRDLDIVVNFTLASGATLLVDGAAVASGQLTLRAPAAELTSSVPFAFHVQAEEPLLNPVQYALRIATAANDDVNWSVGISVDGSSTTVTQDSAAGARAVQLPSDARDATVQLTFTLPYGASIDPPLTGGVATLTAPAGPSATDAEFSFTVTAQDGTTQSGLVTLRFSIAARTDNGWASVGTDLGGSSQLVQEADSGRLLQFPSAVAGQAGTLTFEL